MTLIFILNSYLAHEENLHSDIKYQDNYETNTVVKKDNSKQSGKKEQITLTKIDTDKKKHNTQKKIKLDKTKDKEYAKQIDKYDQHLQEENYDDHQEMYDKDSYDIGKNFHEEQTKQGQIEKKKDDDGKCSSIIKHFNTCAEFKYCAHYQVNAYYANYGCSACMKGYELIEDEEGSGYCIPVTNGSVKNCLLNSLKKVNGKHVNICKKCEDNYILSYDKKLCVKKRITKCIVIDNCAAYSENKEKQVVCEECKPGYTLKEDKSACLNGCTVENCKTCVIEKGVSKCKACSNGTIAFYDTKNKIYNECMTCNTWQCKLLTKKGQICCLKDKL